MCRSYQVEWGWKGGSHREIMQLAQHRTVRLSRHFTVNFKSYIKKKKQHVFRKLSSAYLFHACSHLYKWRSEFFIFISKIQLFNFVILSLISHYFSCSEYFLIFRYIISTVQALRIQTWVKENLCLPGTCWLMRETGMSVLTLQHNMPMGDNTWTGFQGLSKSFSVRGNIIHTQSTSWRMASGDQTMMRNSVSLAQMLYGKIRVGGLRWQEIWL